MKNRLPASCLAVAAVFLAGCYRVKLDGLSYSPQDGWIHEDPTSEHRLVQYRLRGKPQEVGDARLVVYYFGRDGMGAIDENIQRWAAQFQQPDGRPSLEVAAVDRREINGLAVHTIQIEGTYVAETAEGERLNRPDRSMRAAVVISDAGPYYFKVVGPTPTVQRWEPTYDAALASLQSEPMKVRPEESEGSVEEVTP